jgi:hypothetical protein
VTRLPPVIVDAHNDLLLELVLSREEGKFGDLVLRTGDERLFDRYWLPRLEAGGVGSQICPLYAAEKQYAHACPAHSRSSQSGRLVAEIWKLRRSSPSGAAECYPVNRGGFLAFARLTTLTAALSLAMGGGFTMGLSGAGGSGTTPGGGGGGGGGMISPVLSILPCGAFALT